MDYINSPRQGVLSLPYERRTALTPSIFHSQCPKLADTNLSSPAEARMSTLDPLLPVRGCPLSADFMVAAAAPCEGTTRVGSRQT